MAQHAGELSVGVQSLGQPFGDEHLAAGQGEGVDRLGGDAADVLLFLGDGIEYAAAEVAEQGDDSDDEGYPESAALTPA